jgi:uncharacterized protein involved in type VI secretion and phage assembly
MDSEDPANQGRVKISLPWAPDHDGDRFEIWARLATLMAGDGRGTWFVPDPGDEVLVAFQGGDPRCPFVLGSLWNGKDSPPFAMDPANRLRAICSRSGATIEFHDSDDKGNSSLVIQTAGGAKVILDDGADRLTIEDQNHNVVRLDSKGVHILGVGHVKIDSGEITLNAGTVYVQAGSVEVAGRIKADQVVAKTMIADSYTNGAGNIW